MKTTDFLDEIRAESYPLTHHEDEAVRNLACDIQKLDPHKIYIKMRQRGRTITTMDKKLQATRRDYNRLRHEHARLLDAVRQIKSGVSTLMTT